MAIGMFKTQMISYEIKFFCVGDDELNCEKYAKKTYYDYKEAINDVFEYIKYFVSELYNDYNVIIQYMNRAQGSDLPMIKLYTNDPHPFNDVDIVVAVFNVETLEGS